MITSDNGMLYWLWLQEVCGAGSSVPELLLSAFDGNIEKVYLAKAEDYAGVDGLRLSTAQKLCNKSLEGPMQTLAYCKNESIGILTPDSVLYPKRLSRIQGKPAVIFYRGILVDLDKEVCIAEVGTRDMTEYGSRMAYTMAYDMAKAGAVVVSGMAKGVDGMAHRGALDAGGYTVAVLGCGVDRAYPAEHRSLMNEIIKSGVVMSEFKPFTAPLGRNFPQRNRIISGLSLGTLVIEAPAKSGALITARDALKQGRDVFAIPGKLGEINSTGGNDLIKEGARMVTSASDLLLEYQSVYPSKINLNRITAIRSRNFAPASHAAAETAYAPLIKNDDAVIKHALEESERFIAAEAGESFFSVLKNTKSDNEPRIKTEKTPEKNKRSDVREDKRRMFVVPDGVSEIQKSILELLNSEGEMSADRLSVKTGKLIAEILVELTMLEIEGHICAVPGGNFKINI